MTISAPEDFSFEPAKSASNPSPSPPYVRRSQHCYDPVWESVDQHAINESLVEYSTFREFLWNLVFKNEYTDIYKARAIFRWLTCKNLNAIEFVDEQPGTPGSLLNNFKNGKGSYARIFEILARFSGLHSVSISGWGKGASYTADASHAAPNHSWNAVFIDGDWQFVDCHWATRYKTPESRQDEKLIDAYDDFYFLPLPETMIYTHFPSDPAWQLLDKPLSARAFDELPLVRSHFFSLGLDLLQQHSHTEYTKKGLLSIKLGFSRPTSFTYKIAYDDGSGERVEKLDGRNLSRYVLQEMTSDRLTFYFRAPRPGIYNLIVFAREVNDYEQPNANMLFKTVCDFNILSDQAADAELKPFPYCSDSGWGLDTYVRRYPMVPDTKRGILVCPAGHGEVSFIKQDPRLRVYARLVYEGKSFAALKRCLKVVDDGAQPSVIVDLPDKGEYGLEVFVNDPEQDGDMYAHFCQYLCSFLPPHDFTALYGEAHSSTGKFSKLDSEEADVEIPEYTPHEESIYKTQVSSKPPEDFAPIALSEQETVDRPPASYTYKKQFTDISIFKNVDEHARQVAKEQHGSFRELIWHLIYVRDIQNELDKLRAVFVYLCSIDLRKISFSNVEAGSPEELLVKLQKGQTTYSHVFEALCSYAGLQCHAVPGVAKGADYQPGMHFTGDQGQHSWNAVKVHETWQLIDCNWAARRIVGKQVAGDNIHYELDEYYFLPSPQQLCYTHHPKEDIWQLLKHPITLEEFEGLALIKSAFFKNGLHLINHKEAVIRARDEVTIEIGCTPAKTKFMKFTFKLTHENLGEIYDGKELTQYGMQQIIDNRSCFTLRLPEKGSYRFIFYAKDLTQQRDGDSSFSGVGEYEIVADEPSKPINPFPPGAHTSWGQGDSAELYSLVPHHQPAVIKTIHGVAEIVISMEDELRFTAKLKAVGEKDADLVPYLITRTVDKQAIFLVNAPYVGEFGLEIYANNPAVDGQTLHHVYQYLIVCDELHGPAMRFPSLPSGYLGPQAAFQDLGLCIAGFSDPYIVVDTGDSSVSFCLTKPVRMSAQLIYCSAVGDEDCSDYVLQQSGENLVTFVLKLSRPGMYKLQFFAVRAGSESESLPGVYNCLIYCSNSSANLIPFPKQYAPWKDGCYLFEPLDGYLQLNREKQGSASSNQHVFFRLEVLQATAVSVIVGQEWFTLEEEKPGMWKGEVQMDKFWGQADKVSICASYETPPNQYGSLLEYTM